MLTTACTLVSVALALAAPQQLPSIPGAAGRDYPALTSPPRTAFTCSGLKPGYYADPEGGCQVTSWHLVSASADTIMTQKWTNTDIDMTFDVASI